MCRAELRRNMLMDLNDKNGACRMKKRIEREKKKEIKKTKQKNDNEQIEMMNFDYIHPI